MDHTVATGTNSQPGGMGGHFRRGHAATLLPRVAYIGKIDDDTAVNLRLLVPILQLARCLPHVLVGSVQLSAF